MSSRIPFKWGNANFAWNTNPFGARQSKNPFTWDDCALIEEVIQAGAGYQEVFKDKKKKKRFIKLICQIEGVEYKETKEVKERQIRITDIALVAKEVLGIDLKIDI
tara:strand:+ start:480 stop:797 length:318 start_codon:yes stop_codon:yes gene_type:complete